MELTAATQLKQIDETGSLILHHVRGVDHTSPLDLLNTTTSDQTDEIFKATCT